MTGKKRPEHPASRLDRRSFMRGAAGLSGVAAGGVAPGLLGCPVPIQAGPAADVDVVLGLYPRSMFDDEVEAARQAFEQMDLSWLQAGDSVFLKVASNSGEAHPAVTSPSSVRGAVRALRAAGAGRVIVGDQAGVQQVRLVEGDVRFSSTRAIFERNGLLAAAEAEGAELHFFDDHGYEDGYFEATLPDNSSWAKPMMLPNIVRDVDHIMYLPRISSHMLSGYTHATKIAIGWLRDDSRKHLHHDAASFYEKFVEISFAEEIRSRFRGAFTFAPKLLLHQGPDFGTVLEADPMVAVASSHLAHHDAVAVAVLTLFDRVTPAEISGLAYGPWADVANYLFLTFVVEDSTGIAWGPDGPELYTSYVSHNYPGGLGADRALTHAYNLLGGAPPSVPVRFDGERPSESLRFHLEAFSGGLLDVTGA